MKWHVKINERPDDGGYEYTVSLNISADLARAIIDQNKLRSPDDRVDTKALAALIPHMNGHAWEKEAAFGAIYGWIMEQEKRPVTVFDGVIEL